MAAGGAAVMVAAPATDARAPRAIQYVPTSTVQVTGTQMAAVPTSFLGFSMNMNEMEAYTSQPAFAQFVKLLTPAGTGPFVLRVGGTQADQSYWNGEAEHVMSQYLVPASRRITIDNAWLQSLAGMVQATGSNVILNVNAAAHYPEMALDFIEAAEQVLPPGSLTEVAIGNEPDLYPGGVDGITASLAPWVRRFSALRYDTLFSLYAQTLLHRLPGLALAGPEVATPRSSWDWSLLANDPNMVRLITEHYYAYNACVAKGTVNYPELYKYFRATDIATATATLTPSIQVAHNAGVGYRLTELGSSTCLGLPAVNDTFATALWGLDQLYALVQAGVNGVNFHLRSQQPNTAIEATSKGLTAKPLLYGIAAFASTLGPNASLTQVTGQLPANVKVWAVHSDNGWSLALINDMTQRERVLVQAPTSAPMTVRALSASTPWALSATFGGQTISGAGTWQGAEHSSTVTPVEGDYSFTIPPDSALIASTVPPAAASATTSTTSTTTTPTTTTSTTTTSTSTTTTTTSTSTSTSTTTTPTTTTTTTTSTTTTPAG